MGIINFVASILTMYGLLKSKPMKKYTLILVLQLNFLDMLDSLLITPTALFHIVNAILLKPETMFPLSCYLIIGFDNFTLEAGVPFYFFLSLDRFLATVCPSVYQHISRPYTICASVTAWGFSIILQTVGFYNLTAFPYVSVCLYVAVVKAEYFNFITYFNLASSITAISLYILNLLVLKFQLYLAVKIGSGNVADIKKRISSKATKTLALLAVLHAITVPIAAFGNVIGVFLSIKTNLGPFFATLYRQNAIFQFNHLLYMCAKVS